MNLDKFPNFAIGNPRLSKITRDLTGSSSTFANLKALWLPYYFFKAESEEKSGFKITLPKWWQRADMIRRKKSTKKDSEAEPKIGALPVETQEQEFIKDILSLLSGLIIINSVNFIFIILFNNYQ